MLKICIEVVKPQNLQYKSKPNVGLQCHYGCECHLDSLYIISIYDQLIFLHPEQLPYLSVRIPVTWCHPITILHLHVGPKLK